MSWLHLTFDDGPDPRWTPLVLDALADAGMTATFFLTGPHALAHPDLVARIVSEGHSVGGHGTEHVRLTQQPPERWAELVLPVQQHLTEIAGARCRLFRPPYGDRNAALDSWCAAQGLQVVLWDRDAQDWTNPGADVIAEHLLTSIAPEQVLLLHDAHHADITDRGQTVAALPAILAALEAASLPSRRL